MWYYANLYTHVILSLALAHNDPPRNRVKNETHSKQTSLYFDFSDAKFSFHYLYITYTEWMC